MTWRSRSRSERRFALIFQLRHTVTEEHVSRLAECVEGVMVIDLRSHMRDRVRGLNDRHYDRMAVLAQYQEEQFLATVLLGDDFEYKSWAYSATANSLRDESVEKKRQIDEERRVRRVAAERERMLREKREREERERRAREEKALRAKRERIEAARQRKEEEERRRSLLIKRKEEERRAEEERRR